MEQASHIRSLVIYARTLSRMSRKQNLAHEDDVQSLLAKIQGLDVSKKLMRKLTDSEDFPNSPIQRPRRRRRRAGATGATGTSEASGADETGETRQATTKILTLKSAAKAVRAVRAASPKVIQGSKKLNT